MSDGSPAVFLTRPISAVFLALALAFMLSPLFTRKRLGREVLEIDEQH